MCKTYKAEDEFYKSTINNDGLSTYCKKCQNESVYKWRKKNNPIKKKVLKTTEEKSHTESDYRKKRYQKNKDKILMGQKERYKVNRDNYCDSFKEWRDKNPIKQKLQNLVKYLIKNKIIEEPHTCSVNGCIYNNSEHEYLYISDDPLIIVPVCRSHKMQINGAIKRNDKQTIYNIDKNMIKTFTVTKTANELINEYKDKLDKKSLLREFMGIGYPENLSKTVINIEIKRALRLWANWCIQNSEIKLKF